MREAFRKIVAVICLGTAVLTSVPAASLAAPAGESINYPANAAVVAAFTAIIFIQGC